MEKRSFRKELQKIFDSVKNSNSIIEIMGSYRRGAKNSGDIDIIISDPDDEELVFTNFIDNLLFQKRERKIFNGYYIIHFIGSASILFL